MRKAIPSSFTVIARNPIRWFVACVVLIALLSGIVSAANAATARSLAEKQWANLHTRGVLRVGIDPGSRPFSFDDGTGWQGLDADVTRAVARRMGLEISTDPVGYDSLYDALDLWQVDIVVSALPIDPAHLSKVSYTESYFDAGPRLVVPVTSTVREAGNLAGRRVAVALGSDADRTARYWERRLPNMSLVAMVDDASALRSLDTGSADAAIVDALSAVPSRASSSRLVANSIAPVLYVMAVRRDNPLLLDALNRTLRAMQADGTLEAIVARWTSAGH